MAKFVWRVARGDPEGCHYRWHGTRRPFDLESGSPGGVLAASFDGRYHEYDPMDHPALFREFADLGNRPEDLLGFADQWGHLTAGVRVESPYPDSEQVPENVAAVLRWPGGRFDPLGPRADIDLEPGEEDEWLWRLAIEQMRMVVRRWEKGLGRGRTDRSDTCRRDIELNLRYRVTAAFDDAGGLRITGQN